MTQATGLGSQTSVTTRRRVSGVRAMLLGVCVGSVLASLAAPPAAAQSPAPASSAPAAVAAAEGSGASNATPASRAAEGASVPAPDLGGLEPAVAASLAAARDAVVALLQQPDAAPVGLAAPWGDLGRLYHAYGLHEAAAVCYREAARLDAGTMDWPYLLAVVEMARGELAAARAAFDAALRFAAYPPARIALAEIALLEGRTADAFREVTEALNLAPGEPAALAVLGQAKLADGDHRGAAEALEAALAAVPAADRLRYPLAMAYRGLGDEPRARAELGRAGRTGVRPVDPLLARVDAARTGAIVALLRGRRAALAGDWAAATTAFAAAVAADPENVGARVDLGAALASTGDLAASRKELETALGRDANNLTARFNLGSVLLFAGDAAGAEPHLRAVVAARPDDVGALTALGEAVLQLGRAPELRYLEQAVLLDPAAEPARFHEAVALLRLESWALARQRLEDGLAKLTGAGRLSHLLARLLAIAPDPALRDGARAVELAAAVWAASPQPAHGRTLVLALAEAGRCSEAAALARRLAVDDRDAAAELEGMAKGYDAGPPCRPPLAAGS
jgi:tetratricopeptide (TPR) repeat protein